MGPLDKFIWFLFMMYDIQCHTAMREWLSIGSF
jgi:hypothetical protein